MNETVLGHSLLDNLLNTSIAKELAGIELPNKKSEEYKFTNFTSHLEKNFSPLTKGQGKLDKIEFEKEKLAGFTHHIVFVNGVVNLGLSIIEDFVTIEETKTYSYVSSQAASDPYFKLSQALAPTHYKVQVQPTKMPVKIAMYHFIKHQQDKTFSAIDFSIVTASGTVVEILEKTVVLSPYSSVYFRNLSGNIAANASLNLCKIQNYSQNFSEINGVSLAQEKDSKLFHHVYSFSGQMIRNNLWVTQLGSNVETYMKGLYLLSDKTHVDNHTSVDHTEPHSYSNELYRGILTDKSKGVFNGKIFVRQNAQKTNAFQANNNIVLSDQAQVNTKPQLEIWADDVKCSHGCTVGQLDEEALFYLRARGIEKNHAKKLLLITFAEPTFETISFDFVKKDLQALILKQLG